MNNTHAYAITHKYMSMRKKETDNLYRLVTSIHTHTYNATFLLKTNHVNIFIIGRFFHIHYSFWPSHWLHFKKYKTSKFVALVFPIVSGIYDVTITDANGCSTTGPTLTITN